MDLIASMFDEIIQHVQPPKSFFNFISYLLIKRIGVFHFIRSSYGGFNRIVPCGFVGIKSKKKYVRIELHHLLLPQHHFVLPFQVVQYLYR